MIVIPIPIPLIKVDKKKSQEQCYGVFIHMTNNNLVIVKNFEKNQCSIGESKTTNR